MKWMTAFARKMATLTGLEPATSAVTGRRANRLRYGAFALGLASQSFSQVDVTWC